MGYTNRIVIKLGVLFMNGVKKKKIAIYIVVAVIVLALILTLVLPMVFFKNNVELNEVTVERGDIVKHLTVTGNAKVNKQYNGISASSGEVDNIRFDIGDFVEEGQTILSVGQVYYKAPFDGVISYLNVEEGDLITPQSLMFTVTDGTAYSMVAKINESSYLSVNKGNKATISFSAIPDKTFSATVSAVGADGILSGGATLFEVYLELDEGQDFTNLRNNMTGEIKIVTQHLEDVLIVPVKAISYDGDRPYVTVKEGDNYVSKSVELGASNGIMVEVKSGVTEGDNIFYKKDNSSRMEEMMMQMWGM